MAASPPMTEETTNLVLEHLRHIRTKVDSIDDRVGRVEPPLSTVEGHLANLIVSDAAQNAELDKVSRRLDRIERRLELTDG
jgi:tetrahydromethanopterin S-methyltransferase subunit G